MDYRTEGQASRIEREGELLNYFKSKYGRNKENYLVKIFKFPTSDLENYYWHSQYWGVKLLDSTRFQNICWMEGLAPRVYATELINAYPVKLSDDVGIKEIIEYGTMSEKLQNKILLLLVKFNGYIPKNGFFDSAAMNEINGKYVDFQSTGLTKEAYAKRIREMIIPHSWAGIIYQDAPDIGVDSPTRNLNERIIQLGLDKIDFEGKTVLDLGCNLSSFCNYASEHGAKRVVGLDLPPIIEVAKHYANYRGNWNIDFHGVDLTTITTKQIQELAGIDSFDIIFEFAVMTQINYQSYMHELCNELLIHEDNSPLSQWILDNGNTEQILKNHFNIVELINIEPDKRKVFWCYV